MIELAEVTKKYFRVTALNRVSLNIDENKIYCLLGCNGAGKTTLFKLLAGHMKPSAGRIKIAGKELDSISVNNSVSFIQNGASQFNLKIADLLGIAKELNKEFDSGFAQYMVENFKLNEKKRFKELSFGMQTMVTTILALSNNLKIVLLDEPVLGLDAIMRNKFYNLLSESFQNYPRTIIVSTHLVDEIQKIAEEVIILDKGEVILRSPANEIEEKSYSLTGMAEEIKPFKEQLNCISEITMGGFSTAYIFDRKISVPETVKMQPVGLQDFFIQLTGGKNE